MRTSGHYETIRIGIVGVCIICRLSIRRRAYVVHLGCHDVDFVTHCLKTGIKWLVKLKPNREILGWASESEYRYVLYLQQNTGLGL